MVFGTKADVQVELDRASALPGETVEVAIRIVGGRKDFEIQEGRLELVYENEYTYRHTTGTGRSRSTTSSTATDRTVADSRRFLEAGDVATPLQACQAGEVRVELVRHEDVPRDDGNTKDVKEGEAILESDVRLSLGAPHEWPFELQLPAVVVPCLRTERSRVTWLLKGIG